MSLPFYHIHHFTASNGLGSLWLEWKNEQQDVALLLGVTELDKMITLGFTIISILSVLSSTTRLTASRFTHKLFVLKILKETQ